MTRRATSPEITRSWDGNAASWAAHVRKGHIVRRHILDPALRLAAGDVRGLTVLDAGCGEGAHARMLARAGARVVGVDVAAEMIRIARAEEERRPLGIDYQVASLERLTGVATGSIDLAVAVMVLMGMPRPEKALAELARVLRPGGRLLIVINHPCFAGPGADDYFTPQSARWRFYDGQEEETAFFHRPLGAYTRMLRAAGLAVVELHEPRVSPAVARRVPVLKVHTRIPLLVVIEAMATPQPGPFAAHGW
jgi:SAM-dependent methyltransferase